MSQKKQTKPKISKSKTSSNTKKKKKQKRKPKAPKVDFWYDCPYCDEKTTTKIRESAFQQDAEGNTIIPITCSKCKSKFKLRKLKYGRKWVVVNVNLSPRGSHLKPEEFSETFAQSHPRRRP